MKVSDKTMDLPNTFTHWLTSGVSTGLHALTKKKMKSNLSNLDSIEVKQKKRILKMLSTMNMG